MTSKLDQVADVIDLLQLRADPKVPYLVDEMKKTASVKLQSAMANNPELEDFVTGVDVGRTHAIRKINKALEAHVIRRRGILNQLEKLSAEVEHLNKAVEFLGHTPMRKALSKHTPQDSSVILSRFDLRPEPSKKQIQEGLEKLVKSCTDPSRSQELVSAAVKYETTGILSASLRTQVLNLLKTEDQT